MKYISKTTKLFSRNKLVFAFAMVLSFSIFATSAQALGSSRSYFDVAKPSSTSQCEGGDWRVVREWSWRHGIRQIRVWEANWAKLGFRSYDQCIKYVSTPKPTSKDDCKRWGWRDLGFKSSGDCRKYLKLHPGGGYGGTQIGPSSRVDDEDERD